MNTLLKVIFDPDHININILSDHIKWLPLYLISEIHES